MATYLPVRSFHRKPKIRIGTTLIAWDTTAYVDISDGKVRRDLSHHSSIGRIYPVGPITGSNADAVVVTGLKVDEGSSNSDLLLAASAGEVRTRSTGVYVAGAAVTNITIGTAPSAGNKRIDLVSFHLADSTYVVTAGTVVANAATASAPATPAGNVPLATVAVASSVTAITNANITDVRPRP